MALPTAATALSSGHTTAHAVYDVRAHFGAAGDGSTDDTAAIQSAVTAMSAGDTMYIPATPNGYKLSDSINISKSIQVVSNGAKLTQTGTGKKGLYITASNVTVEGLYMQGRQFTAEQVGEDAIRAEGASWAAKLTNITIRNCRIERWGFYGVVLQFVSSFAVLNNKIADVIYIAIEATSVAYGRIASNDIDMNSTPGHVGEAHGISLDRNETNSLVTDPLPTDVIVTGNVVRNNTIWHGIGQHGGIRISWIANQVYNCYDGILVVGSDNAGGVTTWASKDILVENNLFQSNVTNASYRFGITFWGAPPTADRSTGIISGNRWVGYGKDDGAGVAGCTDIQYTEGLLVTGNTFVNCGTTGMYLRAQNVGLTVIGNMFVDYWCDSFPYAVGIWVDTTTNTAYIADNHFLRGSLTGKSHVMDYGIRVPSPGTGNAITLGVNHWDAAITYPIDDPSNKLAGVLRPEGASGIFTGANTPEAAVTAPIGSIFMRTNGGAVTSLYVKESGTGNTGWVAK